MSSTANPDPDAAMIQQDVTRFDDGEIAGQDPEEQLVPGSPGDVPHQELDVRPGDVDYCEPWTPATPEDGAEDGQE